MRNVVASADRPERRAACAHTCPSAELIEEEFDARIAESASQCSKEGKGAGCKDQEIRGSIMLVM